MSDFVLRRAKSVLGGSRVVRERREEVRLMREEGLKKSDWVLFI